MTLQSLLLLLLFAVECRQGAASTILEEASRAEIRLGDAGAAFEYFSLPRLLSRVIGIDRVVVGVDFQHRFDPANLDALGHLEKLPFLIRLNFSHTSLTDDQITKVRWPNLLQEINLANTAITERGLASLSGLPWLRRLDISGTRVCTLKNYENEALRHLHVDGAPLHKDGLKSLGRFRKLRSISLSFTDCDDSSLTVLNACDGLVEVSIASVPVTDDGIRRLRLSALRHLDARNTRLTLAAFDGDTWSGLRHINLSCDTARTWQCELRTLTSLSNCETVDLSGNILTRDQIARIATLKGVCNLRLSSSKINRDSLESICRMRQLRRLDVSRNGLTDEDIREFASLQNLELLDIRRNKLTGESITILGKMRQLQQLFLAGNPVPIGELEKLRELKSLQTVVVSDAGASERSNGLPFEVIVERGLNDN